MMRFKKFIAVVSCVALASATFAMPVFADDAVVTDDAADSIVAPADGTEAADEGQESIGPEVGDYVTKKGYTYKVTKVTASGGTATLVVFAAQKTAVKVPDTVKIKGAKLKVTQIGAKAFMNNAKITSVKIGANVAVIGDKAFYGCSSLKKINFAGESLRTVGCNTGSKNTKKLTTLKKKWKTCKAFAGTPRTCKNTVPAVQNFEFGYADCVRQLLGYAGYKGLVSSAH